ncbi:hypothetical protein GQ42DRAFT_161923 [Ramicandelaber brevisporus]|nr:hypothetical protein GQ42DRAFT_161923 [Ramicandelaber brevisporus]
MLTERDAAAKRAQLMSNMHRSLSKLNGNLRLLEHHLDLAVENTEALTQLAASQAALFMGAQHTASERLAINNNSSNGPY